MLKINEIFRSIQGESTFAGRPCSFIRLSGCNLRCGYCDTKYAYFDSDEMSVDRVLSIAREHKTSLVEVTGGEPLLQAETPSLTGALLRKGYTVLLETNGAVDIACLGKELDSRNLHIIMDIKTPGSHAAGTLLPCNLSVLRPWDEVKLVVRDFSDFEWASEFISDHDLSSKVIVNMSPVFGKVSLTDLSEWILEYGLEVRLNIQLHKIIWGEFKQGV